MLQFDSPREMSMFMPSKRFCAISGILLVLMVVASIHPSAHKNLETANNLIWRYKCPAGSYPAGKHDKNGNCLCIECPIGYRCRGGYRGKERCPRGTYQDRKGQNKCKKSPPGHVVGLRGQPKAKPCPAGSYQQSSGRQTCVPASPGYYVPQADMKRQIKCPAGQFQNLPGQTKCKPAPKGTYVRLRGQTRPTACNYGTYNDVTGQTICKLARIGRHVSQRGQQRDKACSRNTFQRCAGQMYCMPCPLGARSGRGASQCHYLKNLSLHTRFEVTRLTPKQKLQRKGKLMAMRLEKRFEKVVKKKPTKGIQMMHFVVKRFFHTKKPPTRSKDSRRRS